MTHKKKRRFILYLCAKLVSVKTVCSEATRKQTEGGRSWHVVWLQQALCWKNRLQLPLNL